MAKTYLFWEPLSDNIFHERDESGALVAEYTTEPGLYGHVISQCDSGVERQLVCDALGSIVAVTNEGQNVTDIRSYTSFGETSENIGSSILPFQYVGQAGYYHTKPGQYSARQRHLSSQLGRWLSPDPVTEEWTIGSTQAIREYYCYVANSPSSRIDPSGLPNPSPQPKPPPGNKVCQVQLACVRLLPVYVGPKHCGIEIRDAQGIDRFHVPFGDTCRVSSGRVKPPWVPGHDYYIVASWGDASGFLCQCIRATVNAINNNAVNMPYWPVLVTALIHTASGNRSATVITPRTAL